eukprot:5786672-Karenia_brevis.AAC.1
MPRMPRRVANCKGCGVQLQTTVFYCDLCGDVFCRRCVININLGVTVYVCTSCVDQQRKSNWTTVKAEAGMPGERTMKNCSANQSNEASAARKWIETTEHDQIPTMQWTKMLHYL